MEDDRTKDLVSLRDSRERTIARLSDAFAHDLLELDEFERRLTVAHRAQGVAELDRLVADLAPAVEAPAAPQVALAPVTTAPLDRVRDRQTIVAVMGGTERRGAWTPPRRLRVVAVMGGVVLDFREAVFGPGVTEVAIYAVMGGAEVLVPPGLAVEMDGIAIMGGFEHCDRSPLERDPGRPVLRVSGVACMGGVSIQTRLPGESDRDAARRSKQERKALRERSQKLLPGGDR